MEEIHKNGITCSFRLDPIIPGINDEEIEDIVREASKYCQHMVASTIKPRRDSMKRILSHIPRLKYMEWERIGNSFYLSRPLRFSLLSQAEKMAKKYGITFATCREGYPFKAKSCDGSHLIPGDESGK